MHSNYFLQLNSIDYAVFLHPSGLKIRLVDAGLLTNLFAGLIGLRTNSPPQFGHFPCKILSTQLLQNVHSKEQMRASVEAGGKSLLQHSQLGLSSSMMISCVYCETVFCKLEKFLMGCIPNLRMVFVFSVPVLGIPLCS